MLALGTVRRPALLRQVFAVAAGSPAQIISLQKMQGQLQDSGALETVAHYLALLGDACLIAALEKYAVQANRRRSAPPKLVTLNNGLLSAMHPEGAPDREREPARFGQWVENACLALAINQGQQVMYWRVERLEIDGVLEGSWGKWAVEVKTGRFGAQDLRGLLEFCRRYPAFTPLVITAPGDEETARRLGLQSVSWMDFLFAGPPEMGSPTSLSSEAICWTFRATIYFLSRCDPMSSIWSTDPLTAFAFTAHPWFRRGLF